MRSVKESVIPILKENGLPQPLYGFAMTGGGETDCRAPFGARNDRTVVNRTFYGGCNDRIVSIVLICKLRIIKLCIKAVLFKQLLVRALLSHPAAVHNKYAVGVAYC